MENLKKDGIRKKREKGSATRNISIAAFASENIYPSLDTPVLEAPYFSFVKVGMEGVEK